MVRCQISIGKKGKFLIVQDLTIDAEPSITVHG